MPMTLTGTFDRKNIKREWTSGEGYGYETITNGYVGMEVDGLTDYRIHYKPSSGDAFTADGTPQELRIRFTLKKKTDETSGAGFALGYYNAPLVGSYEAIDDGEYFDRIQKYTGYSKLYAEDGTGSQEVVYSTTDSTAISYILENGIGLWGVEDVFQITSCVLELDVTSIYTPPEISMVDGYGKIIDGKYWHYPYNPFAIRVVYTQELDSPLSSLYLVYTDTDGGSETVEAYGTNEVTLPVSYWKYLPKSGTITLYAYSGAGTKSNVIEIPFEVAMYTVAFTSHTSGSIVQSDSDLVITWAATAPDTPSELMLSQEPTQYIRYIWWDDEEPTSGTYITGTSDTVSAEALAAHSVLHMAVPEVYGDYGQRDIASAAVLNLYIQQAAGVNAVTISPLDSDGKITNQFVVSWTSTAQAAYQVQVGDLYDSGVVWGSANSHRVQRFFGFGAYQADVYPVRIRIQGEDGVWTDWTEPVYVTRTNWSYGNGPEISAVPSENGVMLRVDTSGYYSGDPTKLLIYRDGRQIAQLLPGGGIAEYVDRDANGTVEYTAYLIPEHEWEDSGSCWDCLPVTVDATPATDGLFLPDLTWVPLRYTTSAPRQYRTNVSEETHAKYYAGRAYPVFMRSGRKTKELVMSYASVGSELADLLEEAAGEMVIYKNRLGQVIHGELNQVSAVRGRLACEVSFAVSQADYTDEIPYTW